MTHADVSVETKNKIGMTESLVRISVGIEDSDDLIHDIKFFRQGLLRIL